MRYLTLLLLLFVTVFKVQAYIVTNDSSTVIEDLSAKKIHNQQAVVVTQVLMKHHFSKIPVEDSLSAFVYNAFLTSIDYNKMYFTKKNLAEFETYRYQIDNYMISGDLTFPFAFYNKFRNLFYKRHHLIDSTLDQGFDFTKDE